MLRIATDENFNGNLLRGLLRRRPDLDVVRVQDAGLIGADDPAVLAWAAEQGRVLLSHDVRTMIAHARERIAAGQPMPGLVEVDQKGSSAVIVDDLILLIECSSDEEWKGRWGFVPL